MSTTRILTAELRDVGHKAQRDWKLRATLMAARIMNHVEHSYFRSEHPGGEWQLIFFKFMIL